MSVGSQLCQGSSTLWGFWGRVSYVCISNKASVSESVCKLNPICRGLHVSALCDSSGLTQKLRSLHCLGRLKYDGGRSQAIFWLYIS